MGSRGRNANQGAPLALVAPTDSVPRLAAPSELTAEQTAEWYAVVNAMPPDWFMRGNQELLVQYCRHVTAARKLSKFIEEYEGKPADYVKLLKQQESETRSINNLLRSMRLTPRSVSKSDRASHPKLVVNPWDDNAA